MDVATLTTLQEDVPGLGIAFGSPETIPTPADRPKLQHPDTTHGIAVGEGSLMQLVGFIIEAHYSHVQSGQSVNCNIAGEPTNDIHVAIGQALDAAECTSITAEIIPHFRPRMDGARDVERAGCRDAAAKRTPRSAAPLHGTSDVRCEPHALHERPAGE